MEPGAALRGDTVGRGGAGPGGGPGALGVSEVRGAPQMDCDMNCIGAHRQGTVLSTARARPPLPPVMTILGQVQLPDFEPPRVPQAHQPRLYVLMVFEQRPATPPNTPTDVLLQPGLQGGLQGHQGPLGRHPDLQQFLGDRSSFPLTSWLRSNSPKMARIAACQQFRAHLSDADLSGLSIAGLPDQQRDDQGVLGDVEDSEHSSDERPPQQHQDHDKENQAADPSRKSKRSKLSRLRRLLRRKQHCPV